MIGDAIDQVRDGAEGHVLETRQESTSPVPSAREGFALFMLCHHFGRRGRAMARSLARQVNCPVPLQLNVFYHRAEDAKLIEEGAADGPTPLRLRLIPVPECRILQRALLFSEAHTLHDLPYTVFCDADLWFPPEFWAEYVSSLGGEPPGYWSCRVMNIPMPHAEEFAVQWAEITREKLDTVAAGRRHDWYSGQVGHFQCIPRELAIYPPDPRVGVETSDLAFSKLAIERSVHRRTERRICRVGAYHLDHPPSWHGTGGIQL